MRRLSMPVCVMAVFASLLLAAPAAFAAKAVAKITSYRGEVIILSEDKVTTVTQSGVSLNHGDKVQTKQGEAEITFWDGSVMRMNPFTSSMVQEQEEESGWWLFKSKGMARRITVFVGKLGFKSGASQTKNYLQTPTAICGLRGSEAETGYNNVSSFLNQISGGSDTVGAFVRGVFENPGIDAATKNNLYNALVSAQAAYQQAAQAPGQALQQAQASLAGLQAVQAAATALLGNPDPAVAGQAQAALAETTVKIQQKQQEINQIPTTTPATTTGAPTTTTGAPTTSAGAPTTSAGAPTTSAGAPTTSAMRETTSAGVPTTTTAMMTTTAAMATITFPLPSLTFTTLFQTTTSLRTMTSLITTTTTSAATTTTTSRPVSPIRPGPP